jgi:hypothetical protein
MARGRRAVELREAGGDLSETEQLYAYLFVEVAQARAHAEIEALAKLRTAPSNEWVRHAWWLERARGYVRTERRIESLDIDTAAPEPRDVWGSDNPLEIARKAETWTSSN